MKERMIVQIVSSLIFFWAAFGVISDGGFFQFLIAAAAAYVWFTIDYKFEVPRAKVKEMLNQNKGPKQPWDRQIKR